MHTDPGRPVRLFALLASRNGLRNLPGSLGHVAPHVDGIAALAGGSTDESVELLTTLPR